jgi:hypothetical protein
MKRVPATLSVTDQELVDQARPSELARLDEEGAMELERRVRRSRDKHITQYRRAARAEIAESRARGEVRPEEYRELEKAEILGQALAAIDRRVAVLSRESARLLREERLAAARGSRPAPVPQQRQPAGPPEQRTQRDPHEAAVLRAPVTKKRWAATKAQGARNQARRDSRLAPLLRAGTPSLLARRSQRRSALPG